MYTDPLAGMMSELISVWPKYWTLDLQLNMESF